MARIVLDITKNIDENASTYFENAKKARKKIKGIDKALGIFYTERDVFIKKEESKKVHHAHHVEPYIPVHWYEKFHWFISSEGALCVGGRDATQNEILIKKHIAPSDIIFHSEAPGSPFFIVKIDGIDGKNIGTIGDSTYNEVAQATLSYSKAWKLGIMSADVYSFTPDQISKTAQSGEYLTKGSFMIRGKRTYYRATIGLAIGMHDNMIIGGPVHAVRESASSAISIGLGELKPSDAAKHIKSALAYSGHVDDIIRFLPSGKIGIKSV